MTKSKKILSGQMNLFDQVRKAGELTRQSENPPRGSLDIDAELRSAISEDIKHAVDLNGKELSRNEVAARMSDLAGCEITASMLYNYTAEAHEKHRFPCQFLPAFVMATGGQRRTFEILSNHSGLFALPGPEALRSEIQKIDERVRKLKQEKQKRQFYLKELEGDIRHG